MEDIAVPAILFGSLFSGAPWVILHYVTKWKQAPKITDKEVNLASFMPIFKIAPGPPQSGLPDEGLTESKGVAPK